MFKFLFFPFQINLGIYVKDNKTEFSVLVDRSVGGASLADGDIELMVHRLAHYLSDGSDGCQNLSVIPFQILPWVLFGYLDETYIPK